MITVFNLSSIVYIPVSLTTIVFYTQPALVVLATAALMRDRVYSVEFAAVAAAFCGLFIALEVSFTPSPPRPRPRGSIRTHLRCHVRGDQSSSGRDRLHRGHFYMAISAAVLSALTLVPEGGMAMPESFEESRS